MTREIIEIIMNEQLLTTYSFFAALTENSTDIYRTVYIPICKRALSLYAKKVVSSSLSARMRGNFIDEILN